MIPSHKRNARIGLLLAFLAWAAAVAMYAVMARSRERELHALAVIASLVAAPLYTWGCVQYAKAKGYSGWMGAIGLIGLLGLLALFLMDDRDAEGNGVRRADDPLLFPSDERVGQRATPQAGIDSRLRSREFEVRFGSALGVHGFGFVRTGRVTLAGDTLIYQGPRRWPLVARLGAFLAVTVALYFLVALLAPFLALALQHYYAAFEGELELKVADLQLLGLRGRTLTLMALDPDTGAARKSILRLESDQHAAEFAQLLDSRRLAEAA